jgi:hypothetical protein
MNIFEGGATVSDWNNLALHVVYILCLVTMIVAADETNRQQQMVEAIRRSITPEEHAWHQKQHELYLLAHPEKPLFCSGHRTVQPRTSSVPGVLSRHLRKAASGATLVDRVLILANKTLYENAEVKEKVDRYMQDIASGHGCTVEIEVLEGGSAEDIKDILKSYYENGGLDGAIQIGSFPVGWMEFESDPFFGKYETWTCDHFYMDLDGEWVDSDNNGFYEENHNGSGDRSPEIFYARIDASPMGRFGTEIELLCGYLDKTHAYWSGDIPLTNTACELVEKDWANSEQHLGRVYGQENTEIFRYGRSKSVSRDDYLENRLTTDYTLLHLWCHSGYTGHEFTDGGHLSYVDVHDAAPKPAGYFHDGCSLADWSAANGRGYLGGSYVFNESPTALVCVSGTRTGQWIGTAGREMFEELSKNTCVGKAYQIWFDKYLKNGEMDRDPHYIMAWNYGYVILGDPMTTFITRMVTETVDRDNKNANMIDPGLIEYHTNPFTRKMEISFCLQKASEFTLRLCDLSGKEIACMTNSVPSGGRHMLDLTMEGLNSGVYVISLISGAYKVSRQVCIAY